MTSKKHRLAIEESLSSALEPPRKRQPSPALNEILSQYATTPPAELETAPPAEDISRTPPTPRTPPTSPTVPTAATPPTSRTSRTPPTSPVKENTLPVAPERDFTRVPNSVVRDVVPAGYFTGKSKQLYDYLYQRTRGAIVPVRSMKISKPALMKGCGIGSERTLLKNLEHLKGLGLVRVTYTDGKHEGNSYEVFMPEEAGLPTSRTPPTPPTAVTPRHPREEVPPVPPVESGVRGVGSAPLESTVSRDSKTFIKTSIENDDDESFAGFLRTVKKAVKEVTGRETSPAERQRWEELAEVLMTELKIAAGRTTISSAPAFLTEHLRRRLWKKDKRQIAEEGSSEVAKSVTRVDASKCPDCFGTGMYYPEGYEKGVAKCPHTKLEPESEG